MTEYSFNVKSIRPYTTGGTTYWEKDKIYQCKTEDFVTFRVNSNITAYSYCELGMALFHEYFEIADTLSKLPHLYEWMDDEFKAEVDNTRFFDFVKQDVKRVSVQYGYELSDEVGCEVAYNMLYDTDPEEGSCYYMDWLAQQVVHFGLGQCG